MAKSTFYCSHCGKGNVVSAPINGQKFNCLNCRQTNTVLIQIDGESNAQSLKEITQRQPVTVAGSQTSNIHRKKTLLDKNIDLLEKIEDMEADNVQLKSEYLEVSKQLSLASNAEGGISEEQFEEIKTSLEVINSVKTELDSFQNLKVQVEEMSGLFDLVNELKSNQEKVSKEASSTQHVLNNVAGDVQAIKKGLDGIINSINNISVNASVQPAAPSSTSSSGMAPQNTTQILTADEPASTQSYAQSATKPKKRSRSFKAVSDKLKNLKL